MKKRVILRTFQLFVVLISAFIYFYIMSPGVGFTDSGELALCCHSLSISHPTGYPSFTLAGHLMRLIPISPRFITRLNIMSVVLVLASIIIYIQILYYLVGFNSYSDGSENGDSLYSVIRDPVVFTTAVIPFCFSWHMLNAASELEVHSLQILLSLSSLLAFINVFPSGKSDAYNFRWIILTFFFCGLALTNHMTSIVLVGIIALNLFQLLHRLKQKEFRIILTSMTFFILGASVYLYLPIRSHQQPIIDWGDPENVSDLIHHLTGRQFRFNLFQSLSESRNNLLDFLTRIPRETGYWAFLSPVGAIWLWRRNKRIAITLLLIFCTNAILVSNYIIFDLEPYYFLASFVMHLFAGLGVWAIMHHHFKRSLVMPILMLGLSFSPLLWNFTQLNKHELNITETYAKQLASKLPYGSLLISRHWSYFSSAFLYLQNVENLRPDIIFIERNLLLQNWYLNQLRISNQLFADKINDVFLEYKIELDRFDAGLEASIGGIQDRYNLMMHRLLTSYDHPIFITGDVLDMPQAFESFKLDPFGLVIGVNVRDLPLLTPDEFPWPMPFRVLDRKLPQALLIRYRDSFTTYSDYLSFKGHFELAKRWRNHLRTLPIIKSIPENAP